MPFENSKGLIPIILTIFLLSSHNYFIFVCLKKIKSLEEILSPHGENEVKILEEKIISLSNDLLRSTSEDQEEKPKVK